MYLPVLAFIALVALQFIISRPSVSTKVAQEGAGDGSSIHARRKLQHAASGIGICYAYHYILTDSQTAMTLLFSTLFVYVVHRLRLIYPALNKLLISLLAPILRRREHNQLPGAAFVLLGCGITILLFEHDIALLSILYLSIGDPLASLCGQLSGPNRRRWPIGDHDKSMIGSTGMAIACAFTTYIVMNMINVRDKTSSIPTSQLVSSSTVIAWSIAGGILSACSEACGSFTIGGIRIDDNLSVPFGSALLLWIAQSTGLLTHL